MRETAPLLVLLLTLYTQASPILLEIDSRSVSSFTTLSPAQDQSLVVEHTLLPYSPHISHHPYVAGADRNLPRVVQPSSPGVLLVLLRQMPPCRMRRSMSLNTLPVGFGSVAFVRFIV